MIFLGMQEDIYTDVEKLEQSIAQSRKALDIYRTRVEEEAALAVIKRRDELEKKMDQDVRMAEKHHERVLRHYNSFRGRLTVRKAETAEGMHKKCVKLEAEINELITRERIPAICRYRLWYTIYMPVYLYEYAIVGALLLFAAFLLPVLIYMLIPNRHIWHFFVIFPICLMATVMIHLLMIRSTRGHRDTLIRCRSKMNEINELKHSIRREERYVIQDPETVAQKTRDEEQRLKRAESRLENSRKARADALLNFELVTREEILNEFRRRSEIKVQELTRVIQGLEEERDRRIREIEAGAGEAGSGQTFSPEADSTETDSSPEQMTDGSEQSS